MSRHRLPIERTHRTGLARSRSRIARALGLFCSLLLASGEVSAAPKIRIAVAPFAGESNAMPVARALSGQFTVRGLDRVIAPGEFVAPSTFEPTASEVRRWAYVTAVDAIVVGRVSPVGKDAKGDSRIVEAVLRSGHSGAELARYDIVVPRDAELDGSVERLAIEILEGLGYVEPPGDELDGERPTPAVSAAARDEPGREVASIAEPSAPTGRLAAELSRSGFRGDAPIEIKADEAEIIDREQGRRLIFQRNVRVRQANVTLQSERLEAFYRKGDSEPRELIAEGKVEIEQEDRRAKCDRAVYLRESNRLTCQGHAELVQGCDVVRGESIEFDLAGDQARVDGAASIVIQPEDADRVECPIDRAEP